jgi:uncharacterized metal-binding protein YceD (DUF177 family)
MTIAMREHRLDHPWSVPVAVTEVPETGRNFDLVADERVRTAVAQIAGLRALPRLAASFEVSRRGRGGLRVVGRVNATVGQICGVTLEPMEEEVDEPVDVLFSPDATSVPAETPGEVEIPPEDGPEPLVDGIVDLGALATEFLILGINPYPRRRDAKFEPPPANEDVENPFAALAALKKDDGQG